MAKKIGVQVGQQYVNVHNTWKPTPVWEVKSIYPDDLGIDHAGLVNLKDPLAKNVYQVHGVDGSGGVVFRRQLRRGQMLPFFKKQPLCLVGMEACANSHHWAREIEALGHQVRLTPPPYVKPYVKRNKNDMADAEAICEAVTRPRSPLQRPGLVECWPGDVRAELHGEPSDPCRNADLGVGPALESVRIHTAASSRRVWGRH